MYDKGSDIMNTYQLECFLVLAKTLNYAKTAELMYTSQPAITRQIQSLEKELHTQLFNRSKHHVELSEDGKSFITDAKNIVSISNHAIEKFDQKKAKEIQTLSIACAGLSHMNILTPALKELKKSHPFLHPNLLTIPIPHALKKIEDGLLDIVLAAKMSKDKVKNCVYKEITKTNLVCIYNESFNIHTKNGISLKELKNYPLILFHPIDISESILSNENFIKDPSNEIYYCDYPSEALLLALSGMGIAILPEILIPNCISINKQALLDMPKVSYGIYHHPNAHSDLIQNFVEEAKKAVNDK